MTKRGGRGPGRSCSFAFFFVCVCVHRVVCVAPGHKYTLSSRAALFQPAFLSLRFSILVRLLSHHTSSSRPPAPPPFLPTKPAPSLHLIPPLLFIPPIPPTPASPPAFVLLALITAGLSEGLFRLFSPLPLKEQVSLGVRRRAWAETVFFGAGRYKIGRACLFSEKKNPLKT